MQSHILEKVLEIIVSPRIEEINVTNCELEKYLNKIKQVFDIGELSRQNISQRNVID